MPARTIKNCSLIKKMGTRPDTDEGKCVGFGTIDGSGVEDDEPCEICKECKHNNTYEANN